jgi:hypothetical protein
VGALRQRREEGHQGRCGAEDARVAAELGTTDPEPVEAEDTTDTTGDAGKED